MMKNIVSNTIDLEIWIFFLTLKTLVQVGICLGYSIDSSSFDLKS